LRLTGGLHRDRVDLEFGDAGLEACVPKAPLVEDESMFNGSSQLGVTIAQIGGPGRSMRVEPFVGCRLMLDHIIKLFDSWARRWELWIFSPGSTFPREKNPIGSFPFFLLNLGAAYAVAVVISMTYFVLAHLKVFRKHFENDPGDVLTIISEVGLLFVASVSIAYFLASVVSFVGFRWAGSKVPYRDHLKSFLELSFVEPIVATVTTVGFLVFPLDILDRHNGLGITIFLLCYLVSRAWALLASYFSFRAQHMLPKRKFLFAFLSSHLLGYAVLGFIGPIFSWVALVAIVKGGD
jgi:hypothetical protein